MCTCRETINKQLEAANAKIATGFCFNRNDGRPSMTLAPPMIALEKIDKKKRSKPPTLLASWCPFCGEKLS